MTLGGSDLFHCSWGAIDFFVPGLAHFFCNIYYKMNYKMNFFILIFFTQVETNKDWQCCHHQEQFRHVGECLGKITLGGSKRILCSSLTKNSFVRSVMGKNGEQLSLSDLA